VKAATSAAPSRRKGVIWNALGTSMFAANTLIMLIVVSRTSSVATVGCFGIALAVAQLLYNIGIFGVNLFQMTDYQEQYAFFNYLHTRIFTCLLMMLVCAVIVIWIMPEPEKKLLTFLLTLFFLTHAFGDLFQSLFFQQNRLDLSGQALFFRSLLALLAFTAVQVLVRDTAFALVATILASIISVVAWGVLRARPWFSGRSGINRGRIAEVLRSCLPLFVSSFLVVFIFNAARYGIDWLLDDTAQGYFSLIVLPVFVINLVSQFIFMPVLNDFSRALKAGDRHRFFHLLTRQSFLVALITAVIAAAMPPLGVPLLTLLYAVDLSGFSLEAALLIVGGGLFALNQLFYSVLVTMRRQTSILLAYGVGVVFAVLVAVALIASRGLFGACLALVLSQVPVLLLFIGAVTRGLSVKRGKV
jgi:O-antigen/teichoic acid export membrane protein